MRWMQVVRVALLGPLLFCATPHAETLYVRQIAGDDAGDGLTPTTAVRTLRRAGARLRAGDTLYVGPGLYREELHAPEGGEPERPITIVADADGSRTGDLPGVVMIAGSDPVDEAAFKPTGVPGVYTGDASMLPALGMTEMDGPQTRYRKMDETREYGVEKLPPRTVIERVRGSYWVDESAKELVFHTSDDRPPTEHEIEIVRRGSGVWAVGRPYVTVMGFTFRHAGLAGVTFLNGSHHGRAMHNVSYGCHQGIQVFNSTDVLAYGNVLFRNDNAGIYFADHSLRGAAIGNVAHENVKGIRLGSESNGGLVVDNLLARNVERGLSLEHTAGTTVRGNTLAANAASEIFLSDAIYDSDANCFATRSDDHPIVETLAGIRHRTLADYQKAMGQDLHSQVATCRRTPAPLDVHALHRQATAYPDPPHAESQPTGWGQWLRSWLGAAPTRR